VSLFTDKYAKDLTELPSTTRAASRFYSSFNNLINTYRGGMPAGLMAAIAQHESGGRMIAGDASLGEFGFFQITSDFPRTVGVDPEVRKTPDGNVFLAGLEYNVEAQRIKNRYVDLIVDGTQDQWMLARAVFALGIGALTKLVALAQQAGLGRTRGQLYADLVRFVDANPNVSVSGYPPGKVWYRVKSVPAQWQIGQGVLSQAPGIPVKVPAPSGITYNLPRGVSLPKAAGGMILALLAGGALFWWLRSRR